MGIGTRVTGHINTPAGRTQFTGTVTDAYRTGGKDAVNVLCDDDQERTALAENVQVAAKLTPKMQDALNKIRANGGRVGYGLNSFKSLGVNAHSVQALRGRGLLEFRSESGIAWLYLAA
jgi:hypothetical protein